MGMPISVSSGPAPGGLPDPAELSPAPGGRGRTALSRLTTAIRRNRKATAGVILLLLFTLVALFPNLIPHYSPTEIFYGPKCPSCYSRPALVQAWPSSAHWLGTDLEGHDVFTQVIVGTRPVLILAVVTGLLTTFIAVIVGVAAAYLGGMTDSLLNLLTDVLLVIPLFPLLIIIVKYAGQSGNLVLILVLTITGWSYTARQLRSQAMSLRNRDFLLAARVRGERSFYVITVEMIPTMTSLLLACFLGNALYAVLAGSGLQFLGLGDPNLVSWGTTLYWADSQGALQSGLYLWEIVPGLCIALLGAAFALLNYAFDEISNPALRPLRARKRPKKAKAVVAAPLGRGLATDDAHAS
jgi:peptide/nickel transport system permease protein